MFLLVFVIFLLQTLCVISYNETETLQFNPTRCCSIILILNNENLLKSIAQNEFEYLGYKWQRIDARYSLLQLTCDNQSIRVIQTDGGKEFFEKEIKITAIDVLPNYPLIYVNNSFTVGGFFGEVFNIFKTQFNTSFKIIGNKHNQFGAFINGSWTGMIGDLTQGTADISCGISVTRQRRDYVNFSPEFYSEELKIMYRKIDEHEYNYSFYLQPFSSAMWLCVFAINLLVISVNVLANYVSRRKHFRNFSDELLLCWPIVLQGNFNSLSWKSVKFVFGIYIVFSMLIFISHNSILTSLLATTDTKVPFSSLGEMFMKNEFLPVILKGSITEEIFQKPPYENWPVSKVRDLKEGIELVDNGKFGFIIPIEGVEHHIQNNCNFAVASHSVDRQSVSLGYSKQFPYAEYFNYKSLLLKQCGILSVDYQRYYFTKPPVCLENQFNPVSFGQIIGPFVILMGAILISLITWLFELIIYKFIL